MTQPPQEKDITAMPSVGERPVVAPPVDEGVDLDGPEAIPANVPEGGPQRPKAEGRRRSEKRKVEGEKKDQSQLAAEAFYLAKNPELFAIVSKPGIERVGDDGETTEIPIEEWSYAAYADQVAMDALGMSWEETTVDLGDGKTKTQRKKRFAVNQSPELHQQAREAIAQLLLREVTEAQTDEQGKVTEQLVPTRFATDANRVKQVIDEMYALTRRKDLDRTAVLRASVKRPGEEGDGGPLEFRVKGSKTTLEETRMRALKNSVDWFSQRVADAEASMRGITARNNAEDTIQMRITELDNSPVFRAQLAELEADIALFKKVLSEAGVDAGNDRKSGEIKSRMTAQIAFAERTLKRLESQRDSLRKLAEIPAGETMTLVEKKRSMVAEQLGGIGGSFTTAADYELIGLSPDEELNFWDALNEGLNDTVRPIRRRDGATEAEWLADRNKRVVRLNAILNFYEKRPVGGKDKAFLVRSERKEVPEDEAPFGFDQLVIRAKAEAQLLAELNKKLKLTTAILGPEFKAFVRRELRGEANSTKLDKVDKLNKIVADSQRFVLDQLKGQPLPPETLAAIEVAVKAAADKAAAGSTETAPAEAESVAAPADEATKKVPTFNDALAGRELRDLRWNVAADKPLLELVRSSLYARLVIGKPGKLDREAAALYLDITPVEDTKAEQELQAEETASEPLFDRIVKGELLEAIVAEAGFTAESLKAKLIDLRRQLQDALQAKKVVRDDLVRSLEARVPTGGVKTSLDLNEYIADWELTIKRCAEVKAFLGKQWTELVGMTQDVDGQTEPQVNPEVGVTIVNNLDSKWSMVRSLSVHATEAFNEAVAAKIKPELRAEFAALEIHDEELVSMMIELAGRATAKGFDANVPMQRLLNYLKLGAQDKKGFELLKEKSVIKLVSTEGEAEPIAHIQFEVLNQIFDSEAYDQA